jgi:Fe2+ transport system protein FeoA
MDGLDFERIRSLATVRDDETLVVQHILFDANRVRLAAAGVTEGDRIRARASGPSHVQIETSRGAVLELERSWANFVRVREACADC